MIGLLLKKQTREKWTKKGLSGLFILFLAACETPVTNRQSIDDIIASIETEDGTSSGQVSPPKSVIIPEGQKSTLAEEALASAFVSARKQQDIEPILREHSKAENTVFYKSTGQFRIALLLPLTGEAADVGNDIRSGAEMAFFQLGLDHIDIVFFDTSNNIESASKQAIESGADVILGPLFASNTLQARQLVANQRIPIISFSNDIYIASPETYMLGQTPEQEIETVLKYALETLKPHASSYRTKPAIAIISQNSLYGNRVTATAIEQLTAVEMTPTANVTLNSNTLANEQELRQAVRILTNWQESSSDETDVPPSFDAVVLAGDVQFSLRVAPILAWHGLEPEKTRYLGTSLWSSPAILQEPSLNGGLFATASSQRRASFDALWQDSGNTVPGPYATLGFDAVALMATVADQNSEDFRLNFNNDAGFAGFSGMFKLLADGRNIRLLDVHQIDDGTSKVVRPAPVSFAESN